ncbi:ABC transporter ATP-binding protein [Hoeflea sp. G2-23]|uniref:ABC transporter ATP-binding protein n=1 Tax=Hoeflea algicola TaxID=2983763 RepID=A0ABT3ZF02_9HYPH|nr:ABC transporter ATP-binding protein [Hoeflea algicola]MCY0150369.1 ABC transporter ATP-binding protein [Hoeflea algicola]
MIELSDVHVTFNPGTPLETKALRGVNLNVPEGQFLTVIGSNGAGKSTCLNLIAGLCRPASGTVAVAGDDISDWPIYRRSKFLSRVFQDPKMGTCEDLTILENFALAQGRTRPRGFRMAVTRTIKDEAAERLKVLGLGLENRLHDKVGLLSGGQRQAVSLLMATTGDTKVLLLDEHTAALDPKTAGFVLELTQSIVAELKLTVVMVTHSMAQALHVGDRTVMFHRGRIVTDIDGPKRAAMHVNDLLALFKQEQHEELSDDALLLG